MQKQNGISINVLSFLVFTNILCASAVQAKIATDVFKEVSPSVVIVRTYDTQGKEKMLGSGVTLEDGVVVTNCHVLNDAATIQVHRHEIKYMATLLQSDWDRDICTLSVNGLKGHPVTKGSTSRLQVGDKVYAVGAPKGLELTLSDGLISSLRPVEGGQYLQITAPISPGSSGGGLFDEEGQLIGLPTFYLTEGQQLNFAVPIEWVNDLPKRNAPAPKTVQAASTEWLNQAITLEGKKDWPGMINHALRWTQALPKDAAAWFYLGIAYLENNQNDKAVAALLQVIRINPELAFAWTLLGSAYEKINQSDKAIEAFQQAVRVDPQNASVWAVLGISYEKINQSDKAIEAFQQAVRVDPQNASVWAVLGAAYGDSNQSEKEIDAFQQVTRITPKNAAAWYTLGAAYVKSNQSDKAIKAYQQVVRIQPENAEVWYNLGNILGASNQPVEAIEAFRQVIRINPKYIDAWYYLGVVYKLNGQTSQVMEVYKHLKTLDPAIANIFFNKFVTP